MNVRGKGARNRRGEAARLIAIAVGEGEAAERARERLGMSADEVEEHRAAKRRREERESRAIEGWTKLGERAADGDVDSQLKVFEYLRAALPSVLCGGRIDAAILKAALATIDVTVERIKPRAAKRIRRDLQTAIHLVALLEHFMQYGDGSEEHSSPMTRKEAIEALARRGVNGNHSKRNIENYLRTAREAWARPGDPEVWGEWTRNRIEENRREVRTTTRAPKRLLKT